MTTPLTASLAGRLVTVERAIRANNWKQVAVENQATLVDELRELERAICEDPADSRLRELTRLTVIYSKKTWTVQNARYLATTIDALLTAIQFRWPTPGVLR